jgi:predicted RNase H-like HicB family nuclease
MRKIRYTAIYELAEEGGYVGYLAELPGANTQGETLDETRENLIDAAELLLDCLGEDTETKQGTSR